jgi:iron complex transport system permease protein
MSDLAAEASLRARRERRRLPLLATLALALLGGALLALTIGPYRLALLQVVHTLAGGATGQAEVVIWNIRLPRVLAAMLVGAALAAAGASYQVLFRNPLVSPDILGVSSGAALGAVCGIFLSLPVIAIQGMAFLGGILAVGLVIMVASAVRGVDKTLVLVLTGVVMGALAGAATSLLKVMADPYDQLPAITLWLLGSLASTTRADLGPVLPAVLLGLVPIVLFRCRINLLSLGDDEARALGVDAFRLRLRVISAATLVTASVVAIAGVVGWVGLVIPHIARMLVGPSFAILLPAAAIRGAGYLLLVDTLCRTLGTVEIPLGILTAVLGAPCFLYLLGRARRGWT